MSEAKSNTGWTKVRCHCGALQAEVRLRTRRALECNCSVCIKKGFLHLFVTHEDIREGPTTHRREYQFGTRTARHYFCDQCGITPYYVPRSHPNGISVNARCIEGFAPADFEIVPFDGQNWEQNIDSIRD